jgi:hypothetical protein
MSDYDNEHARPDNDEVQGEVITDERTGEEIPKGAGLIVSSNQNTQIEISKVGTLQLTPQAEQVLGEKLDPKDVKIRPDGLVYLPWTYYANKLNQAFGRLQWGLLPQGAPQLKPQGEYGDVLVVWGHWLAVKGVPIGFAYGETTYKPTNATMSYGDACEGAKSSALARNCKQLGIALELWDADWIVNWKREYAEQYTNDKNRKVWRKKGSPKAQAPKSDKKSEPQKAYSTESSQEGSGRTQSENTGDGASEQPRASGAVSVAQELAAEYTGNQILGSKDGALVKEIVELSGKPTPVVCGYVAKLEKGKKFTLGQIVKALTEEKS